MDKAISYIRILFQILTLGLIVLSLYPGSIIGFLLYGDFRLQPQITKDFLFISSNHIYVYFFISALGFFSYSRDRKFKLVVIYLFFLSIILEVAHLVISERSFQIEDLNGNILGVLTVSYTHLKLPTKRIV